MRLPQRAGMRSRSKLDARAVRTEPQQWNAPRSRQDWGGPRRRPNEARLTKRTTTATPRAVVVPTPRRRPQRSRLDQAGDRAANVTVCLCRRPVFSEMRSENGVNALYRAWSQRGAALPRPALSRCRPLSSRTGAPFNASTPRGTRAVDRGRSARREKARRGRHRRDEHLLADTQATSLPASDKTNATGPRARDEKTLRTPCHGASDETITASPPACPTVHPSPCPPRRPTSGFNRG